MSSGEGVRNVGRLTKEQYQALRRELNPDRITTRSQAGKDLSYLEVWDIRATLTRVFGFGGWDCETLEFAYMGRRDYMSQPKGNQDPKPMVEVTYTARVRLTVRDSDGYLICTHVAGAAGSEAVPDYMLGDAHDNALKTAESDALKRCAINLGNQFGLSLYRRPSARERSQPHEGRTRDVVGRPLVFPEGGEDWPGAAQAPDVAEKPPAVEGREESTPSAEQQASIDRSLRGGRKGRDQRAAVEDAAGMPGKQEDGS